MANWDLRVVTNGVESGSLIRAKSRKLSYKLNDFGDLSFSVPITSDYDNFELNLIEDSSEIRAYMNEQPVWAGAVTDITDDISVRQKSVKISCKELGYFLKDRYITDALGPIQESAIAWYLINKTQTDTLSGLFTSAHTSFGITQGTLENFQLRERTYENDEISKSLKQLTDVINGGDWELTPTLKKPSLKQFSWYAERGGQVDVKFDMEDGSIEKVVRKIDMKNIANYIIGIGAGISTVRYDNDFTRVERYKVRQFVYTNKDISILSTLNEHCDGILAERKQPLITYDFTITNNTQLGSYDVGDWVRFRASLADTGGRFEVDAIQRVFEIQVDIADDDTEKVKLTVGQFKPYKQNNLVGILKNQENRLSVVEKY